MNKQLQTELLMRAREVTEAQYDEMLGCLPPERMHGNAFLVGEPVRHKKEGNTYVPTFDLYFSHEGKYYTGGEVTVKEYELFLIPATI